MKANEESASLEGFILILVIMTVCSVFFQGCFMTGRTKGIEFTGRYNTCGTADGVQDCAEDIQTIIEATVHQFVSKTGVEVDTDHVYGLIERIEFFAVPIPCHTCTASMHANEAGIETRYKGLLMKYGDRYTIRLHAQPCLAFTSLAHELVHMLAETSLGLEDADYFHTLPFLWGADGVVYGANKMAINEGICNADNVEWRVK